MGRPTKYSKAVADEICGRLASGETILRMCERDKNLPAETTVYRWLFEDGKEYFRENYERARAVQAERFAEELADIADDGRNDWIESNDPNNPGYKANGEYVQRSRLRVDTRKWIASRLLPKKYGDKQELRHTGKDGESLNVNIIQSFPNNT